MKCKGIGTSPGVALGRLRLYHPQETAVSRGQIAPEETEGAELERAVFRLARALVRGGPPDVGVKEPAWGETERDGKSRLLRRTVRAVCVVCLTGEEEPSAVFSEFEVRGGLKE